MRSAQQILQQLDAADLDGSTLPQALCEACLVALPVTGVAMALMSSRGSEGLVAATNDVAATLEELQFTLGEGPCIDSSVLGHPVLQPDLRDTAPAQWPGLGPAALEAGIEAIFAFPLQAGGARLGALDLYRDTPGVLNADEVEQALSFSVAATQILLRLQDQTPTYGSLHPDLLRPQHDRAEVHQAIGMISVQAAVALSEASLLLRARAYAEERNVVQIARDVITRKVRFVPTDTDTEGEGEDHD